MDITTGQTRPAHAHVWLIVGMLALVVLTAGACTFEVQPIEEYTSPDGYLSFTFPAAWDVLDEDASDGTTTVFIGTNPDLIDMDVIPSAEAGIGIMLMPNFIPEPGLDTVTLAPEELAALMRESAASELGNEVTEIEPVVLADENEGYTFTAPSPDADMTVTVFSPAPEILAVAAVVSAPGEQSPERMAEAEQILNSVRFNGDPAEFADRTRVIMGGG